MPSRPSPPKYIPPQQQQIRPPSPRARTALLETERRAQAKAAKKRKGYQSTVLTKGLGLGDLRTQRQEAKAFKLGE